MILSGKEILKRIGKEIEIEPFDEKLLNPNSYNLRLHNELLVYENDILDMKKENRTKSLIIPEEGMILEPVRIYPMVEICQIYYHSIEGEYDKYTSGKYQNNNGIQPSLLYKDFEK
jgi:dCTP deaminase